MSLVIGNNTGQDPRQTALMLPSRVLLPQEGSRDLEHPSGRARPGTPAPGQSQARLPRHRPCCRTPWPPPEQPMSSLYKVGLYIWFYLVKREPSSKRKVLKSAEPTCPGLPRGRHCEQSVWSVSNSTIHPMGLCCSKRPRGAFMALREETPPPLVETQGNSGGKEMAGLYLWKGNLMELEKNGKQIRHKSMESPHQGEPRFSGQGSTPWAELPVSRI